MKLKWYSFYSFGRGSAVYPTNNCAAVSSSVTIIKINVIEIPKGTGGKKTPRFSNVLGKHSMVTINAIM